MKTNAGDSAYSKPPVNKGLESQSNQFSSIRNFNSSPLSINTSSIPRSDFSLNISSNINQNKSSQQQFPQQNVKKTQGGGEERKSFSNPSAGLKISHSNTNLSFQGSSSSSGNKDESLKRKKPTSSSASSNKPPASLTPSPTTSIEKKKRKTSAGRGQSETSSVSSQIAPVAFTTLEEEQEKYLKIETEAVQSLNQYESLIDNILNEIQEQDVKLIDLQLKSTATSTLVSFEEVLVQNYASSKNRKGEEEEGLIEEGGGEKKKEEINKSQQAVAIVGSNKENKREDVEMEGN